MTTKPARSRAVIALTLLAAAPGCLGAIARDPIGGGAAGLPGEEESGATSTETTPATSSSTSPQGEGVGAESPGPADVIISSSNVDQDGAIAADAVNVYWTVLDATGVYDLMSCPVLGCTEAGPTVLSTNVYAGSVVGEIVPAGGLVYFQAAGGDIMECAAAGCGGAPTLYAHADGQDGSASLATDGSYLFWRDGGKILSCALGATCGASVTVAHADVVRQIVVDGGTMYWVDGDGTLNGAPAAGGPATAICNVPLAASGLIGEGSLAILDGSAYVSTGVQPEMGSGGVYRCDLSGGEATLYANDRAAIYVQTDGEAVFWLSGDPSGSSKILSCAPGASCTAPVTFVATTPHLEGFALEGSFVYSVAAEIRRTVKM